MMNQQSDRENIEKEIAGHYAEILRLIGEDVTRDGLVKTPMRAARALLHATSGYSKDIDRVVNGALFDVDARDMVVVRDVEFYSLCEHHVLPFYGHVSVAYIPSGKILGLSKVARIVEMYARRLQVQERLTVEIRDAIARIIGSESVMVVSKAHHLCMKMRGVEKQDSTTVTVSKGGVFAENPDLCREFYDSLRV